VIQRDELIRWWANIEPTLVRFARSYGLNLESSRDAVQDLAVLVLKQYSKAVRDRGKDYSQFADEKEFKRWAYARLHWIMLDQFKSTKLILEPIEHIPEKSVPPGQEEALIVGDIVNLIDELPSNQRIALLGSLKGQTNEDIAQQLQVKEATVRSLQRYARIRLAALLARQEIRR
jgi:RNA polymerase sigma factor (sigma-70 family)